MRPAVTHPVPGMPIGKHLFHPGLHGIQVPLPHGVGPNHLTYQSVLPICSQSMTDSMLGLVPDNFPAGIHHPGPFAHAPVAHGLQNAPPPPTHAHRTMAPPPAEPCCRRTHTPTRAPTCNRPSLVGHQVAPFPPHSPRTAPMGLGDPRLLSPAATGAGVVSYADTPATHGSPLMFSQEEVDMVLYGYARSNGTDQSSPGHALSGLRVGELSYGIDRILSRPGSSGSPCSSPEQPAVVTSSCRSPVVQVMDTTKVDIPEGLELHQTAFAGTVHYGVFCKDTVISRGTRFGPFLGRQVNTSEVKTKDDNSFMWEIFREGRLSHFIDGRCAGNWMTFVNCARYAQEQNLLAVQYEGGIHYEVCKDIPQGTELLVWYGDCYLQFMGIPIALKEMANNASTEEIENSEGFQCERCGKVFAYKYYRDKHLKYTRCVDMGDRKFPCHICSRSFEKRDRLRIHVLHVHERHRPHKCSVCSKSFSQSSSLNKHMRVHSGERPYKCVYCSKAFTASSILRTHIRQHSGEKPFKCKHCGKAFASHAAHDSHVRRTHAKERSIICNVCGKAFSQLYELRFHLRTHTGSNTESHYSGRQSLVPGKTADDPIDVVGLDMKGTARGVPTKKAPVTC